MKNDEYSDSKLTQYQKIIKLLLKDKELTFCELHDMFKSFVIENSMQFKLRCFLDIFDIFVEVGIITANRKSKKSVKKYTIF